MFKTNLNLLAFEETDQVDTQVEEVVLQGT